jgi:ADP-heptose:LPS heptosyltransferase
MSSSPRNTTNPPSGGSVPGLYPTPRRILILSAAGIGDFVLATPALRAIRRRFSGAEIWALTIAEVRPLAERCPYLNYVRTIDLRRSRSALVWTFGSRRREFWGLVHELRGMSFDLALNLHCGGTFLGGLRMWSFLRLIGPTYTLARSDTDREVHNRSAGEPRHEVDAQLDLVRLIGAAPADDRPELWITAEDRQACHTLLATRGIRGDALFACIHFGSAQQEKRWPTDRFAAVGRRVAEVGAQVLLIGGTGERALGESLAREIPGGVSLVGETPLPLLAALLERAALLITNDSGPMHMAAALGTPLVVAFGPGSPNRFGPRGRAASRVLSSTQHRGGPPWWEGVPVEAVCEAALDLLDEASADRPPQDSTS